MTPFEIEAIESSFHCLTRRQDDFAFRFYDKLFDIDPSLRPLLRDVVEGGDRLMAVMAIVVRSMRNPGLIDEALRTRKPGCRGHGIRQQDYRTVGAALIWALERTLGSEWTPELKRAWSKLYAKAADTMRRAAAERAA